MPHKKQFLLPGIFIFCFIFLSTLPVSEAQKNRKKTTYDQAYSNAEPRLFKSLPSIREWLDDAHYLLVEEDETSHSQKLFKVNAAKNTKTLFLDYGQIQKALPERIRASGHVDLTEDFTGFLYTDKGDLYYYSRANNTLKRLTATSGEEQNPRLSPDGKQVAFTRDHNLYTLDIASGLEYQLTEDGSKTIYNGWASWVYYEEILGRRSRHAAFWWAPDSRHIAFLRFDDSPVPTFPLFSSKGDHGKLEIERYPKAGDPNPFVKLGVVSATGRNIVWADIEEKTDHYVAWPFWLRDSSKLTFQWMNRDQNHIKIYAMDLETGKKKEFYEENQPAWVEFFEDLYFFKDGSGFLLRSDRDGWRHLYTYDLEGNQKKRLTEGDWTVTSISLVDKNRIGITGGSYGGYTTCMALTCGADYFTHGYARSSVTDWRLYDSVYTERYMDRPIDNPEGYQFGAAMTHADKFKGILFMSHGNLDDNVHMQNTIQLIDKLMELEKSGFEFMIYPDQRHGARGKKREHSNRHYIDFLFKHLLNR